MELKSDAKFEGKLIVVSKMTRMWLILSWALEIPKISILIGTFCGKYRTFDPKKYKEVIFHDNEH